MITPAIVTESILWYRHVNHAERWLCAPMQKTGNAHSAFIPGSYTNSPYPLQHYFELPHHGCSYFFICQLNPDVQQPALTCVIFVGEVGRPRTPRIAGSIDHFKRQRRVAEFRQNLQLA